MNNYITYSLRISKSLFADFHKEAKANGRGVSQEIIVLLERYVRLRRAKRDRDRRIERLLEGEK